MCGGGGSNEPLGTWNKASVTTNLCLFLEHYFQTNPHIVQHDQGLRYMDTFLHVCLYICFFVCMCDVYVHVFLYRGAMLTLPMRLWAAQRSTVFFMTFMVVMCGFDSNMP